MNTTLQNVLARTGAAFEVLDHRDAYTAWQRATACHVSGRVVAKTVVVVDPYDDWYALAVLPATHRLDLVGLRKLTGRPHIRLAREAEFARLFPDCELGAVPPLGHAYGGLEVYLDLAFAERPEIIFDAGTHHDEIRMPMRDYLRMERPDIVALTA